MFEIDKIQFGNFLSAQRKAKGFTQKELAQKLFVSDKAVSKWERGLSLPDITLLMPLAELLDVSVTELLEGKRLEHAEKMDADQIEILIKKALTYSEKPPQQIEKQKKTPSDIWLMYPFCIVGIAAAYIIQENGLCAISKFNASFTDTRIVVWRTFFPLCQGTAAGLL